MLTKTDFQQIQKIVKTEVRQETRKVVKEELTPIQKDVKTIMSDISQIRKDIKTIVNYFDREYEEHLGLEPISP